MDILKRSLAPLTGDAWKEIDKRAAEALKSHLSARKVVRVNGPRGLDYTVVPEGRLNIIDNQKDQVRAGIYQVKPLIETRIGFKLDRWEMDNIMRGARDADLGALEQAAKKSALFEEDAVYNGYEKGGIAGLFKSAGHQPLALGSDAPAIMQALSKGVLALKHAFVEQPLSLMVGEEAYHRVNMVYNGHPLVKSIEKLIGGEIIYSSVVNGALLLPYDHEDLELTLGLDYSIGYEGHDSKSVELFIANSFTFRVFNPDLIVPFKTD